MQNNIKYRSDIDGLRALAVLSVIIFHFNNSWLPGGFLGVDIFFVISGYLITSIIKRQLQQNRFSFKEFYNRRIKRILPLFFTVLFVTFIFAILILMPDDYNSFWRSARYAMTFRANRAFTGFDYFNPITEEKPLLHLWSLAIEEQFYFIWPLAFFLGYKVFKRTPSPFIGLFWLAIIGIIISTILAEMSGRVEPNDSYYLLQNRASELLVGCALALNPYPVNAVIKKYLGIVGAIVAVLCFIFLNRSYLIPGIATLIPTIAAALFILDDRTDSAYKRLFTNQFARTIGLWSFSLYLWHWPILAFMRYLNNGVELSLIWLAVAALLTLILSTLSYYLIENPVRKLRFKFLVSLVLIYLLPFGLLTSFNMLVNRTDDSVTQEQLRWFDQDGDGCWERIGEGCSIGDLNSQEHYLLIGDSHAMHLSSMMDIVGQKEGIKIDIIGSSSCPILFSYSSKKETRENCLMINDYLAKNWHQYDAIIFSQLFYGHMYRLKEDTNQHYLADFVETIRTIAAEKPVIVISDIPEFDYNPLRVNWFSQQPILKEMIHRRAPLFNNETANAAIQAALSQIPNTRYVDITPYVNELLNEGDLIYRDQNHLNPYGSRKIGNMFIKEQTLKVSDH